jgi:myo-inositol-1(or 4)-monophosphatase
MPVADFLQTCEEAARAGGAVLLDWIGRFGVREKGRSDPVTDADVASQEAIRRIVLGRFPTHAFIGEEQAGGSLPTSGYCWVVDPLDGTMNYVHGVPHYAVSVALVKGEEIVAGAIYEPQSQECYLAARGEGAYLNGRRLKTSGVEQLSEALVVASFSTTIDRTSPEIAQFIAAVMQCQGIRRTGSAALNLSYVAAGRFDAFWALSTQSWDVAAGVLLVTEAGGVVTDIHSNPFTLRIPHPVAAASGPLQVEFCRMLQQAKSS